MTAGRSALVVFLCVAAILFATHASRVVMTNDEGMILEPAQRMLSGAHPYVDFFGYMSPGSYWLQALAFRIFGISLWAGRVIVILDFSLQCALVFWLTARLSSMLAALIAALAFAGFQVSDPNFLTTQHRWDSATFALAGLCVAISAIARPSALRWIACGALGAAAAWCTPALAFPGAVIAAWLLFDSTRRRQLLPWTAGVALVTACATAALIVNGNLRAFLDQMAWLKANYSGINVMPYGAIIGGYRAIFSDTHSFAEFALRFVLVVFLALPAILPIAGVLLSSLGLWQKKFEPSERRVIALIALSSIAFIATVFPRGDMMHLAFVAALPYALTAIAIARVLPARAGLAIASIVLPFSATFAANCFMGLRDTERVPTPVGTLRVSSSEAASLRALLAQVRPGDTLFVYPYMPLQYFLTQAKNPTRFSFLGPGMMTEHEESVALAELRANPPEFVTFLKLKREEFLRVFPHGSNLNWHFPTLEAWLEENYQPESPPVGIFGYQLWRRAPGGRNMSAMAAQDLP